MSYRQNTADLLHYFSERRQEADEKPEGIRREAAQEAAEQAEYHALTAVLALPYLAEIHDSDPINRRLDQLRTSIAAKL